MVHIKCIYVAMLFCLCSLCVGVCVCVHDYMCACICWHAFPCIPVDGLTSNCWGPVLFCFVLSLFSLYQGTVERQRLFCTTLLATKNCHLLNGCWLLMMTLSSSEQLGTVTKRGAWFSRWLAPDTERRVWFNEWLTTVTERRAWFIDWASGWVEWVAWCRH